MASIEVGNQSSFDGNTLIQEGVFRGSRGSKERLPARNFYQVGSEGRQGLLKVLCA